MKSTEGKYRVKDEEEGYSEEYRGRYREKEKRRKV